MILPISNAKERFKHALSTISLVSATWYSTSTIAQTPKHSIVQGSQWGAGVGVVSNQKAYKDIARDTLIIPIITYENPYIRWFGTHLDVKLPSYEMSHSQQIDFSLSADYDLGSGYDNSEARDTPILNDMDERKGVFALGAKMHWVNPWVDVSAQWMFDVSGDREGNRAKLGFEKKWMFGNHVMLSPRLMLTWQDDHFVDYHYGVRAHEVRNDRPAYRGESSLNIEYGLRSAYMFDKQNAMMLDVGVSQLGSAIKDSPLVDSSTENTLFFIYMHTF